MNDSFKTVFPFPGVVKTAKVAAGCKKKIMQSLFIIKM